VSFVGYEKEMIKKIVVKKSTRRKKTIHARLRNGIMEVIAPVDISEKRLKEVIDNFKRRFEKREKEAQLNRESQLLKRAQELNKRYFGGKLQIKNIRYSARQTRKFGVAYPNRNTIIINGCLNKMPQWVEDYVIIHELAHLIYPNHSKEFWNEVKKYPKAERAIGYLMAKGIEEV
jgi:hypothetical protein